MKKTDLYKNLALKIDREMKQATTPDRFGQGEVLDRKAQRKLDQAKGLVPFAVKLHADLVKQVQAKATADGKSLNEVTAELLQAALAKK